jgi:hypothetical protein
MVVEVAEVLCDVVGGEIVSKLLVRQRVRCGCGRYEKSQSTASVDDRDIDWLKSNSANCAGSLSLARI